ncbi:hydrogenase maturation protease [Thermodesulfatator atlanticus]|uniref:hydrogenase maturation protease n=1 Tax=Thermodesulfatator atlanticus TaxID=501497 RepID=UPI0003B7A755|nr:hydrogenase maturation protease [Thermodesulfatator atlanticus]
MNGSTKAAIIGLGNILFKDEGFGVHLVRYLMNHYRFPVNCQVIDGGCAGLSLLDLMRGNDLVFIIDVYLSQEDPPGSYKIFSWNDIENLKGNNFASVHQFGVKDALGVARLQGIVPEVFKTYAVVPENMDLGLELSPTLAKVLPLLAEKVVSDLTNYNFKIEKV